MGSLIPFNLTIISSAVCFEESNSTLSGMKSSNFFDLELFPCFKISRSFFLMLLTDYLLFVNL